jgi:hypothetical protein
VTLYWVTGTIGSSFRVYRDWALGMEDRPEAWRVHQRDWAAAGVEPRPLEPSERVQVPAAIALFDYQAPREWVERAYLDLRHFVQMPRGGHFAAMEEPELLAADLRSSSERFAEGPGTAGAALPGAAPPLWRSKGRVGLDGPPSSRLATAMPTRVTP